jgi:hypothetical protein
VARGRRLPRYDVAVRNGSSWVALRSDPGPCPGDGWAVLAQRGKPGQRGPDPDLDAIAALADERHQERARAAAEQVATWLRGGDPGPLDPIAQIAIGVVEPLRRAVEEQLEELARYKFNRWRMCGDWRVEERYVVGDIVRLNNDLWIAERDAPRGVAPEHGRAGAAYWTFMLGGLPGGGPVAPTE